MSNPEEGKSKWSPKAKIWLFIGLLVGTFLIWNYWPPGEGHITVSYETTRITGPLKPDGTVDYVRYLNERYGKGVTPENNAVVLLVRCWDAEAFEPETKDEFLQQLGVTGLPAMEPFKSFSDWRKGRRPVEAAFDTDVDRPWKTKEHPQMAEWLGEMRNVLDTAVEASHRPRYFYPIVCPPPQKGTWSRHTAACPNDLFTGLRVRALLALGDGDFKSARGDAIAIHRLGRLFQQSPTCTNLLLGYQYEWLASWVHITVGTNPGLETRWAREYLADIDALPPQGSILESIDVMERFSLLDMIGTVARMEQPMDFLIAGRLPADVAARPIDGSLSWDNVLRRINEAMDHCSPTSGVVTFDGPELNWRQVLSRAERRIAGSGGRATAAIRERLLAEAASDLGNIKCNLGSHAQRSRRMTEAARIPFALALYKADQGHFPEKLEALAPKYLATVPLDPFGERTILYKSIGMAYMFYSVGSNGIDEGGKGDDLAFKSTSNPSATQPTTAGSSQESKSSR
ncbi:MAG: hypothetical protein LLG01_05110 [Planctomycetaceae bacterium]|nr:hypothetical protein [Planctomycetaceae bacterium]